MNISGVDTEKGIGMTGGTEEGYRAVLSVFVKDIEKRTLLIREVPETETLPDFTTHVHALKSASATIGAVEVSARAAELEAAARAGNIDFIQKNLFHFIEKLAELVDNILAVPETEQNVTQEQQSNANELFPLLLDLEAAVKNKNYAAIDRLIDEINGRQIDSKTKSAFEKISDELLIAEYEKAEISIREFLNNL